MKYLLKLLLPCISVIFVTGTELPELKQIFHKLVNKSRENLERPCSRHIIETMEAAAEGEQWALRMLDATAKPSSGVIIGNWKLIGEYDECLGVTQPQNNFIGQYCYLEFNSTGLAPIIQKYIGGENTPISSGAGMGICLPSTCPINDILNQLNSISLANFSMKNYLTFGIYHPDVCKTREFQLPWTNADYACLAVLSFIFLLTLAGTLIDLYLRFYLKLDNKNVVTNPLVICSVYTNTLQLFSQQQQNQFTSMGGLKGLSLLGIILGHVGLFYTTGRFSNVTDTWANIVKPMSIPTNNTQNVTDTFFVLGAMLLVVGFFKEIKNKGGYDFPLALIKRYLRLTPIYALTILFMSTIRLHMTIGPVSVPLEYAYRDACQKNWPYSLLYIHNYMTADDYIKCMSHSWYLDADMQLFVISPFFLYTGLAFPRVGTLLALIFGLLSASGELYEAYIRDWGPAVPFSKTDDQLKYGHYLTHFRATPWFLGVFVGLIFVKIISMGKKFKLTAKTNAILWCFFGTVFFLCQIALYFFDLDYTQPAAAICLSFRRVGWALSIGWMVIACSTGHGETINKFFGWGPFLFISKISYSAYLIHMPVLDILDANKREFLHGDFRELVNGYILVTLVTIIVAIPMTVILEFPCAKIITILFRKSEIFRYPRKKKTISTVQTQVVIEDPKK